MQWLKGPACGWAILADGVEESNKKQEKHTVDVQGSFFSVFLAIVWPLAKEIFCNLCTRFSVVGAVFRFYVVLH